MTEDTTKNIWAAAYEERRMWDRDSDEFVRLGRRVIERRLAETPGFAEYDRGVSHYVTDDPKLPGWMQVWFGKRPMLGRKTTEGRVAVESGPTLVYSRGPSGEMAVILYPVRSDVAQVAEDALILRIGFLGYWDLRLGVARDMRDLIAYAYVTSLDLKPTWRQSLRIQWLRLSRQQIIKGEHHSPPLRSMILKLAKTAGLGGLSGISKLLAPGFIGWLIGAYGNEWLKSLLP